MYVTSLSRDDDSVQFRTHGGGDIAGYVYNGAAYCTLCAEDVDVTVGGETVPMPEAAERDAWDDAGFGVGYVRTSSEWDAPGATCDLCHLRLPTRVIHYDD